MSNSSSGTAYYLTTDCWLGCMFIAGTEHGIRTILFRDTADEFPKEINRLFPATSLVAGNLKGKSAFSRNAQIALAGIQDLKNAKEPTLDLIGTPFQQRVWSALREIPLGQTATYSQIAERVGAPKAVRAVGLACGANPVAVFVPCHRVIRSDGTLGGYRGGLARKRKLLEYEGAISSVTEAMLV
jgi:AraC family transcriptional regulator of adaptative response/methylated-DNA-[protein]-cysteine methyltransferase